MHPFGYRSSRQTFKPIYKYTYILNAVQILIVKILLMRRHIYKHLIHKIKRFHKENDSTRSLPTLLLSTTHYLTSPSTSQRHTMRKYAICFLPICLLPIPPFPFLDFHLPVFSKSHFRKLIIPVDLPLFR